MGTASGLVFCLAVAISAVDSCCFPDKSQGTMDLTGDLTVRGIKIFMQGRFNFSVDTVTNRVYMTGKNNVNGKILDMQIVQDLIKRSNYVISDGKCESQPLKVGDPLGVGFNCVDDKDKLFSTFVDGKIADVYQTKGDDVIKTKTVTPDTCTLIEEETIRKDGTINVKFNNIKLDIDDESVFNVPAVCNSVNRRAVRSKDEPVNDNIAYDSMVNTVLSLAAL